MAGQQRYSIPGFSDYSDDSEEEPIHEQPIADDLVLDTSTPEPCGADVIVESTEEEDEGAILHEGGGDPSGSGHDGDDYHYEEEQEEEEEEEALKEYDPTDAPFIIRKPQPALVASAGVPPVLYSDTFQDLADEAPPRLERQISADDGAEEVEEEMEEEAAEDEVDHHFVTDRSARCVRILPVGYSTRDFLELEPISPEAYETLKERVKRPNPDDDDHFFCDLCAAYYRVCCIKHYPLYRILDRHCPEPMDGRAKKTTPGFLTIKTSSIPGAGQGAFTNVDIPMHVVFGPYQGTLSKESDNRGYSWEIRNPDAPSVFLDGSNPKYSNWMRFINSPRNDKEQNLVAFQYNGSVYYRVIKPIDKGSELLVWYGAKYGETLGVFKTKKPAFRARFTPADNPFIK